MFTEDQQRTLVEIARRAVARSVNGSGAGAVPAFPDLPDATGAFVTLKRRGQLRGCIGTLECRRTLPEEVARVAVSAAREDPRFEPVRPSTSKSPSSVRWSRSIPSIPAQSRLAATVSSSNRAGAAGCSCRRSRPNGAGTARRSCRRPAPRPDFPMTAGAPAPGSTASPPTSSATDVQTVPSLPASSL
jgi:hypothetical protein